MRNLDDYINVAVVRNNFRSKREFCRALGVSASATTAYDNGSFPNEETMVKIADLAGIDRETALLELAIWKTSGAAQKAFSSILQKISHAVIACIFVASLFSVNTDAYAGTLREQVNVNNMTNIHYHFYQSRLQHSPLIHLKAHGPNLIHRNPWVCSAIN